MSGNVIVTAPALGFSSLYGDGGADASQPLNPNCIARHATVTVARLVIISLARLGRQSSLALHEGDRIHSFLSSAQIEANLRVPEWPKRIVWGTSRGAEVLVPEALILVSRRRIRTACSCRAFSMNNTTTDVLNLADHYGIRL